MAPLKLHRIVACSSEDPAFPAKNLLKDGTNNKWKCKAWELMASVTIQLEKPSVISGIDIGNESSAFVEVLVGCDREPNKFKSILSMSRLMTLTDSQNSQQTNQVKIFRVNDLHLPMCTEKWDRIKVVCSHPFNNHEVWSCLHLTSWLSSRNRRIFSQSFWTNWTIGEPFNKSDKHALILDSRTRCNPCDVVPVCFEEGLPGSYRKNTLKKVATPKYKVKDSNKSTPTNADGSKKPNKKAANDTKKTPSKRPSENEPSSSQAQKHLKLAENVIYKPFNKLLEGVELTISGYVNPGRADIRSKVCSMGAKYSPDWTSTCTHLICAFPNTPKFQKAKGNGKIVTVDWINDCFTERKLLPWKRYATDPDNRVESNDSVWELDKNGNDTSSAAVSGEDTSSEPRARVSDRFIATVELIERLRSAMIKHSNDTDTSTNSVVVRRSADGKDTSTGSQAVDPITVTVHQVERQVI